MTADELEMEIKEKTEDLDIFISARDILYNRVMYVQDHSSSKLTPIHEWAGTHAIMNIFEVVIHNMERMIEELQAIKPEEEPLAVVTKGKPTLRLVTNEKDY